MKQLVECHRVHAAHRLFAGDQPLAFHIDRHLQRSLRRALARAGLQHPEFPALDGKLDVLHILIVRFEKVEDTRQFGVSLWHGLFHRKRLCPSCFARGLGQILRGADARHHVFALRIDQILTVIGAFTGCRVAGERNARGRCVAHIAEHHSLHIDRRAPVTGNVIKPAINLGAV